MPRAKTPRNGSALSKSPATASQKAAIPAAKSNGTQLDLETQIRQRAYQLYEERGCTPGHESEDWIVAEREIVARYNHHSA